MKRFLIITAMTVLSTTGLFAKDYVKDEAKCSKADNIIGEYIIVDEDGTSLSKFMKAEDGTYYCQTFGEKPAYDKDGKMRLDKYNPDPKLRNTPLHQAIVISGLKYNAQKKQWDGGKIHHPLRKMLKADCTVDFVDGGKTLRVRGHIGKFGQNKYWQLVN